MLVSAYMKTGGDNIDNVRTLMQTLFVFERASSYSDFGGDGRVRQQLTPLSRSAEAHEHRRRFVYVHSHFFGSHRALPCYEFADYTNHADCWTWW